MKKKNNNRKTKGVDIWLRVYIEVKGLSDVKNKNRLAKYKSLVLDIIRLLIAIVINMIFG